VEAVMTMKIAGTAAVVWLLCLVSPGQAGWRQTHFPSVWGNGSALISAAKSIVGLAPRVPVGIQSSCPGGSCQDNQARPSALRRFWTRQWRPSTRQARLQQEAEEARWRLEQPHPDATAAGQLPESLRYERRGGWYYVIERKTGREVFRIKAGASPGVRRFGTMSWMDRWMRRFRAKKAPVSRNPWHWERREDGTYYGFDSVTGEFKGTFKWSDQ